MCGIVGYIGQKEAVPIVLGGLKQLLPRGYDSAGISALINRQLMVIKDILPDGNFGKFANLVTDSDLTNCHNAIGHTRWATHGKVSVENAHPHLDSSGKIAIVHNGIIENWRKLKDYLIAEYNCQMVSETDSELISHLFGVRLKENGGDIRQAILETVKSLKGTFGLLLQHADHPALLIGVRYGSPLSYTHLSSNSFMIASTTEPFLEHSSSVKHLRDGEIVIIEDGQITELSFENKAISIPTVALEGTVEDVQKEGFPHFMLKEIMTQPRYLQDVLRGRLILDKGDVKLGGIENVLPKLSKAKHFFWLGSGTSYHAALICARMFREHLDVQSEAKLASEVPTDNILAGCDISKTAVIGLSQSGETADLITALEEMRRRQVDLVLGIVNVVGSTITTLTDAGVYLHVGPEMGVASTKAFSAQVLVGTMMMVLLARKQGMSADRGRSWLKALQNIPEQIDLVLKQTDSIKTIAQKIASKPGVMILGRGYHYPTALEGALKIIEVAYLHREAQPAGEMKHGPIAIIEDGYPVFIIATKDNQQQRISNNIKELKSRGAWIIGICTKGDRTMISQVDEYIIIPPAPTKLTTILASVALQLVAYYLGVARGKNVDQPRNLAKAVTVH